MRRILIDKEAVNFNECVFGLPWDHDSACYNFMSVRPDGSIVPSGIGEIDDKGEIESLVIGCDLEDYSGLR